MKKEKTKTPASKIVKYLRELSVVVIGIAITLSVNNLLTTRSEKKDMALYLNAVKLELETNLGELEWLTETVEKEVSYSRYLLSNDKNALHPDTIRFYAQSISAILPVRNAFEMFKTSGSMRFVKDKAILLSIWAAYYDLDGLEMHLDKYHNNEKYAELTKEMQLKREGKPIAVPLYDFYTSRAEYTLSLLQNCKSAKSSLEEAIAKIETIL
ncbi:MAG: hypothetical protein LBF08_02505 [Dysgonamonadaceae bacterium]|jgi:hypothetical protein|nr:hypothetical protein [Dysgonamonadaceae bacterium]